MASAARILHRGLVPRRAPLRLSARTRSVQTSSSQSGFRGSVTSHVVAAGLGAVSTLVGAYAFYRFSGLQALVQKAQATKEKYNQVCTAWSETKPRTPAEAVAFLRRISRPRSGPVADAFVDMIAQFQGSHEEDIDRIVFGAVDDIEAIIAESRAAAAAEGREAVGEEGLSAQDRVKIAEVVQRHAQKLREYVRERKVRGGEEEQGKLNQKIARFRVRHKDAADPSPTAKEDSE